MNYQSLDKQKQYCIKLNKGEEIILALTKFCKKHKITSGYFCGIGATNNLTMGSFDLKTKKYIDTIIKEPLEILSLIGNVSLINNEPFIHAHIVVGKENFTTLGGHLKQCIISLTCEIYLQSYRQKINRSQDHKLGISTLNLLNDL